MDKSEDLAPKHLGALSSNLKSIRLLAWFGRANVVGFLVLALALVGGWLPDSVRQGTVRDAPQLADASERYYHRRSAVRHPRMSLIANTVMLLGLAIASWTSLLLRGWLLKLSRRPVAESGTANSQQDDRLS